MYSWATLRPSVFYLTIWSEPDLDNPPSQEPGPMPQDRRQYYFSRPPGVSLSPFWPHTAVCCLCLKWKISVIQYPALIPTDSQIILFFFILILCFGLKYDFMSQHSQQIHKHHRIQTCLVLKRSKELILLFWKGRTMNEERGEKRFWSHCSEHLFSIPSTGEIFNLQQPLPRSPEKVRKP